VSTRRRARRLSEALAPPKGPAPSTREGLTDAAVAPAPYRVYRDLLPNGLRLSTVETPHLHSAVVAVYVRAGARYETPRTNGLSHFVEHMLFRGSERFPTSFLLNRAIEERGGTLYAETGRDYSLYHVALRPKDVAVAMDILGNLFAAPTFRDIELERPIILEEILEDLDDRGRNVNIHDISRAVAWRGHPLGFPVIGPSRNVRRFTTSDVRQHFRRFYGARNMALCVAGRVKRADVRRLAGQAFAKVPRGKRVEPQAASSHLDGPQVKFVNDEGSQVQLQLVFHAFPEWDPAFPALATLMRLLDDGMSTPLHYRVCDQKGLAYHVSAGLEPLHDSALVEIDAACSPENLAQLVAEILSILRGLATMTVPPAELEKAKRRYIGDLEAGFDDLDGLCGWFGGTELFFRPYSHVERARRVQRVRSEDVQSVASRVFSPKRLTAVAVGPQRPAIAAEVRRLLRKFH
jgi:predicted Zn-dependent peptidase